MKTLTIEGRQYTYSVLDRNNDIAQSQDNESLEEKSEDINQTQKNDAKHIKNLSIDPEKWADEKLLEIKRKKISFIYSELFLEFENSIDTVNSLRFSSALVSILNMASEDNDCKKAVNNIVLSKKFSNRFKNIENIDAKNSNLKYFPNISSMPKISFIDCSHNNLKSLNLKQYAIVNCSNNKISELKLPNAYQVKCNKNHLIEINLPKAKKIECQNNNFLIKITAPKCTTLKYSEDKRRLTINAPNDCNLIIARKKDTIPKNRISVSSVLKKTIDGHWRT